MRLHFKGPYINDDKLPHEEIKKHPYAVKFKEFEDTAKFLLGINIVSFSILLITALIYNHISGIQNISITGVILVFISVIPHEYIHASFFKRNAYVYFHKFALLITGTEPMSKWRFIAMCTTPSIIFGFIPFALYLINNNWTILGTMGGISLAMCLGDFYNAYHGYTQVPDRGLCFMSKQNTYWFVPESDLRTKRLKPTIIDRLYKIVSLAAIAFIIGCGLYGKECVGLAMQIMLYEITLYSIIAYMQIQES